MIIDLASEQQGKVVHRAALLAELLALVPREKMHTSKRLKKITENPAGDLTLDWHDNTQFSCDALIGADGVRGYTRTHILGQDQPGTKAQFGGFWDCKALVPVEAARGILGEDLNKNGEEGQYGWVGDGGFFMRDVLDGGKTVQCVASIITENGWNEEEWKEKLTC